MIRTWAETLVCFALPFVASVTDDVTLFPATTGAGAGAGAGDGAGGKAELLESRGQTDVWQRTIPAPVVRQRRISCLTDGSKQRRPELDPEGGVP